MLSQALDQIPFDLKYRLADLLAEYCHYGQVDKQGKPYIDHVRRVAERCKSNGCSENQIIAALLHDTKEDSFLTLEVIMTLFGYSVYIIVYYMTRGKEQSYDNYIQYMIDYSSTACRVKLADLEDNLDEARGPIPKSLRKRYEKAKKMIEAALKGEE